MANQQTNTLSKFEPKGQPVIEGKRKILTLIGSILGIIILISLPAMMFAQYFYLPADNPERAATLPFNLVILVFSLIGIFFLLRTILGDVKVYQDGITIEALTNFHARWENIEEVQWYYLEWRSPRRIYQGLKLKTLDGKTGRVRAVFRNFPELREYITDKTSKHIAKRIVQQIRKGQPVTVGAYTVTQQGIESSFLKMKNQIAWQDVTQLNDVPAQRRKSPLLILQTKDGKNMELALRGVANAYALRLVIQYFVKTANS